MNALSRDASRSAERIVISVSPSGGCPRSPFPEGGVVCWRTAACGKAAQTRACLRRPLPSCGALRERSDLLRVVLDLALEPSAEVCSDDAKAVDDEAHADRELCELLADAQ